MIEALVLSGCGYYNLDMYGVIYKLIKEKYIVTENIKHIYATSGGAMVALSIVLNINEDHMFNYLHKRPFNNIFNINSFSIDKKGVLDERFVEMLIEPLLRCSQLTSLNTLLDLYNKTGKTLNISTINIKNMSSEIKNHITDPQLSILDAIYMTSAIPYIFKPLKYNNNYYIDGGLCCNFPIDYCLSDNIKKETILGIKTRTINNFTECNIDEMSLINYYSFISRQFMSKIFDLSNKSTYDDYNIIYIDIKENLNLDTCFLLCENNDERLKNLNNGIEIANKHIKVALENV